MSDSTNLLLQGHEGEILTLKYNHTGTILASAGMDRNIMIWTPAKMYENVTVLKSHTSAVISLAFSSQDILFAASADKNVSAWDI
jgi:Prp8 binding protein